MPHLRLDRVLHPGGIALWGALPPVYDTTQHAVEHGVHVHARLKPNGKKDPDDSFSVVDVVDRAAPGGFVRITELEATAYVAAAVFGLNVKSLDCPHCQAAHLDLDQLSVHPHRTHECSVCKLSFSDAEDGMGNPVCAAKAALGDATVTRSMKSLTRALNIDQSNPVYSGGISIWGSNPAIVWTATRQEEEGIHVHGYEAGNDNPTVDQTYGRVSIDNVELDPRAVRNYMVQRRLDFLQNTLTLVACAKCGEPHDDHTAPLGVTPHVDHPCEACGHVTSTPSAVVANPLVKTIPELYAKAALAGLRKNIYLP